MNVFANLVGSVADFFYLIGAYFNNIAVRAKMKHYSDTHPSKGNK